jgi:transposase
MALSPSGKLSRTQVLPFLAQQHRCIVAMEACATAHECGRAIQELGHDVRLIPPAYVKPFVKRQKNDTAQKPLPRPQHGRPCGSLS